MVCESAEFFTHKNLIHARTQSFAAAASALLGGIAAGLLLRIGLGGGKGEGGAVGPGTARPLGKVTLGHDSVDIYEGGLNWREGREKGQWVYHTPESVVLNDFYSNTEASVGARKILSIL